MEDLLFLKVFKSFFLLFLSVKQEQIFWPKHIHSDIMLNLTHSSFKVRGGAGVLWKAEIVFNQKPLKTHHTKAIFRRK